MNNAANNEYQIGVECLVEMNRKYWGSNDTEVVNSDKWIYLLHAVHMEFSICMAESIVTKALQAKEKLPIASIISGRPDDLIGLLDQIDASFGIEQRFCPSYHNYDSEGIRTLAGKMASDTYGKIDALLSLKYRDVRFGEVLFNEILRGGSGRDRGKVFDCFSISQEQYYGHIRDALAAIEQAYEIFKVRRPAYLVTSEYFYTKSLYAYVAKVLGARIVVTSVRRADIMVQIDPDERQLSDIKVSDILRITGEKCLEHYQVGNASGGNFFVMENGCRDKVELPELWNKKQNVFILPHAISDSPRLACRHNFYHDYGEWFIETMKIVKDISEVNWIVKDHPCAAYYGQESYIRSIFEKYKTENMFWMDIEYSGLSIKDMADCVLTYSGDAGIEYWAYGIPTITMGDAYYCSWGISYQMKTLAEYKSTLKDIGNLPKPSKQSVEMAIKYIMACKDWHRHGDAYVNLINDFYSVESSIREKSGTSYGMLDWADQQRGKATRDFLEAFVELMKEQDLRESTIYRLKYLCTL